MDALSELVHSFLYCNWLAGVAFSRAEVSAWRDSTLSSNHSDVSNTKS